jgi:hypothetical protein
MDRREQIISSLANLYNKISKELDLLEIARKQKDYKEEQKCFRNLECYAKETLLEIDKTTGYLRKVQEGNIPQFEVSSAEDLKELFEKHKRHIY